MATSRVVAVRLPQPMYELLKEIAEGEGSTIGGLAADYIRQQIRHQSIVLNNAKAADCIEILMETARQADITGVPSFPEDTPPKPIRLAKSRKSDKHPAPSKVGSGRAKRVGGQVAPPQSLRSETGS